MLQMRRGLVCLLAFAAILSAGQFLDGPGRCQAFAEPFRLGFQGEEVPGEGVRVKAVTPGSPATRLYRVSKKDRAFTLQQGDVVTAVNGKPVRSLREYFDAMNAVAGGNVTITVRDGGTRQSTDWTTQAPGTPATQPNGGPPAKLFLIIVADTNAANIGPSVKQDRDNMRALFRGFIPAGQLRATTLSGNQVEWHTIFSAIDAQRAKGFAAGRDTFVFYYSGHGGYDDRLSDHFFQLSSGRALYLGELKTAIGQLNPRIAVLASDACSVALHPNIAAAPAYPGPPEHVVPLFAALFFNTKPGMLAISATEPGQAATCDERGGYFTDAFCMHALNEGDKTASWSALLKDINDDVKRSYAKSDQTAYVVGSKSAGAPPRFGVSALPTSRSQGKGLEVTRVLLGYPATAMKRIPDDGVTHYLSEQRDIITHVNGRQVLDENSFRTAVANSPDKMRITVLDSKTAATTEYEVNLGGLEDRQGIPSESAPAAPAPAPAPPPP